MGLPALIPSRVLSGPGRLGANDRLGIGFIGCGRRNGQLATGNVGKIPKGETEVVGVADVNLDRADQWADKYKCTPYQNYRKLLERKDLDVVIYATPEFWHYLPCIHAAQADKDIYGEQPLSFTVREGQKMVEAVRKYKCIFQVGEQQRSNPLVRRACELVRNGAIGQLEKAIGRRETVPADLGKPLRNGEARLPRLDNAGPCDQYQSGPLTDGDVADGNKPFSHSIPSPQSG